MLSDGYIVELNGFEFQVWLHVKLSAHLISLLSFLDLKAELKEKLARIYDVKDANAICF